MGRSRHLSYRHRISLAFGLCALVAVILLGLVLVRSSYIELRQLQLDTARRMGAYLADSVAPDLAADRREAVADALQRYVQVSDGAAVPLSAVVVDRSGRRYAAAGQGIDRLLERDPVAAASGKPGTETVEGGHGYVTLTPVPGEGRRLGTLVIRGSLQPVQEGLYRLLIPVVGFSLLLLVAMGVSAWIVGRRFEAPLLRLSRQMRRIGQGELDARFHAEPYDDVLAELSRGFEAMVEGLREKQAMEQEIVEQERLAAIGRVAAGMAHEINNPLGAMRNAINTYERHGHDPEVARRTLSLVRRGLTQMQHTVQALLVNARLEDRALSPQDLADLHTLLEAEAHQAGVQLQWACQEAPPQVLPASQLRQVAMNLVLNAVEATGRDGHVQVECGQSREQFWLQVSDDGPGIPPEERARLFEPFTSGRGSSGLGLWVTLQVVNGLEGRIRILDRERGQGTTFQVWLPLTRPQVDTRRQSADGGGVDAHMSGGR